MFWASIGVFTLPPPTSAKMFVLKYMATNEMPPMFRRSSSVKLFKEYENGRTREAKKMIII